MTLFRWVIRRVKRVARKRRPASAVSKRDYAGNKESARALVHAKLEYFNTHYQYAYKKVFIKNTKTRWGSCSSKGNLNFSYNIVRLPEPLVDYLIVHELCHLGEMNHGPNFWKLVEQTIPDYKTRAQELRKIRLR